MPKKPTPKSTPKTASLVAFGAHPDDIEFGCGGVIAGETGTGRTAHLVVCSRGEAATQGSPAERAHEAEQSAHCLGASLEFIELGGDAHLERMLKHTLALAAIIRRLRPRIVLAPSLAENQHPDHARLGQLVRDAARLARYAGVKELLAQPAHSIEALFFYAVTAEGEPLGIAPVLIDISAPETQARWIAAMKAHASQARGRDYLELQLARARVYGLRASVSHAAPLWPNDPLVFESLASFGNSARRF